MWEGWTISPSFLSFIKPMLFTPSSLLCVPEQIPTLKSAAEVGGRGVNPANTQTRGLIERGSCFRKCRTPRDCVGPPAGRWSPPALPATRSLHRLCPLPASALSLQQPEGQGDHGPGGAATQLTGAGVGPGAQNLSRPCYLTAWPSSGEPSVESRPSGAAWVGWKGPFLSASAGSTTCRQQAKRPSPSGKVRNAGSCSVGFLRHQAPHAHTKCLVWKGQKMRALCWGSPPPPAGEAPHKLPSG